MEIKNGRVPCPKFMAMVDVEVCCWNCLHCQSMEDGMLMCDIRY